MAAHDADIIKNLAKCWGKHMTKVDEWEYDTSSAQEAEVCQKTLLANSKILIATRRITNSVTESIAKDLWEHTLHFLLMFSRGGEVDRSILDNSHSRCFLDLPSAQEAFMKVAKNKEDSWHLSDRISGWAADKGKEMRNMLRHVSQSITK